MNDRESSEDTWGTRTRWTLVQTAANAAGVDSTNAWRELIERYREPVRISFVRRLRGHPDADQAADDFFAYLFEHGVLSKADCDLGRFRCYMQGIVRRYAQGWLRDQRGTPVAPAEELDRIGASEESELEREDERRWAASVLGNALARLRRSHARDAELLTRAYGLAAERVRSRRELESEFGLTENALDVALHRARKRLRDKIVDEVRETVVSAGDAEDELGLLLARLSEAYARLDLGRAS